MYHSIWMAVVGELASEMESINASDIHRKDFCNSPRLENTAMYVHYTKSVVINYEKQQKTDGKHGAVIICS